MAGPSVTNTFANGTTIDATQVNQNFSDLINGATDGTKDYSINALTLAGAFIANGNATLGNASGDDLTVNASLASTINIKTNNSFDFGSSTLGLASVYLGSAGGLTTRLVGGATSSSWTITLPTGAGTDQFMLSTNGSGVTRWSNGFHDQELAANVSISASVAANALTIALKDAAGSDPSATSPVLISFRNSTLATGTNLLRKATAATSLVISSGSTLGHVSGQACPVYIYAIDNAGTIELAASGQKIFNEGLRYTTTAEGGGGASDSNSVLYSGTARTDVAVRLIGMLISNQVTAGTWASAPTHVISNPSNKGYGERSEYSVDGANGHGSTNNKIRRIDTSVRINTGTAFLVASNGTDGTSITILEPGIYSFFYSDGSSGAGERHGLTINSSELTTSISGVTASSIVGVTTASTANTPGGLSVTTYLKCGDVIRPHTTGSQDATSGLIVKLRAIKISD